jgi:hypothetical protein
MRFLRTCASWAILLSFALVRWPAARAQAGSQDLPSASQTTATVKTIRAVPESGGCAVEIISDRPLIPDLSRLENPPRLVIDLPHARLSNGKRQLAFQSSEINQVRVSQFHNSLAQVVIDLARPVTYTWDATGNRLMVRLHAVEDTASTSEASRVTVPVSSTPEGNVVLAGTPLGSGSSITAGADTAVLRLGRGGEVRVCPGTTVSVTASKNGRSLMLGMSTGALEAHYALDASSDSILTPDFRILLAGPGEFHYAISADPHGNTCIQALPGNTASVIVSEVLGEGTYQVKPAEQVTFHAGQLKTADVTLSGNCGCPAPSPAIMRASAAPGEKPTAQDGSHARGLETESLPASKPNDVHVQVDVPFVFRADDPGSAATSTPPPMQEAAMLPTRDLPRSDWFQLAALPPPQDRTAHRGFFGRIRGFFSAIFG